MTKLKIIPRLFVFGLILSSNLIFSQTKKIDSLFRALELQKEDTTRVKTLNALNWQLLLAGEFEESKKYALEAKKLSEKLDFSKGYAASLSSLGAINRNTGNYPEAIKYHLEALKIRRASGFILDVATSLQNIGNVYFDMGDFHKALYFQTIGYKIRKALKNNKGLANSQMCIGNIYSMLGKYPEALEYHINSLKAFETLSDQSSSALCYNNIGAVYELMNNHKLSLQNFKKSLAVNIELGRKNNIASDFSNLGHIFYSESKVDSALYYYNMAKVVYEENGNKNGLGGIYGSIGACYGVLGEWRNALEYHYKSKAIKEEIGDQRGLCSSFLNIGLILSQSGKEHEAEEWFKKSIRLSKEIGNSENLVYSYLRNSQNDSLLSLKPGSPSQISGYLRNSLQNYRNYIVYSDSLTSYENKMKSNQILADFEYEKKEQLIKLEQVKKDIIAGEKLSHEKKQKYYLYAFLALAMVFSVFIYNRFSITKRQKIIIEQKEIETQEQNKIITTQKHIVEEKQKEILDSINYAKKIQYTLLAHDNFLQSNLNDFFVLFMPKDIVSGDFYWATKNENKFYFAVCDSTGHGVPGAFMSLLNINFINEAINEKGIEQPDKIFNYVRNRLIESFKNEGQQDGFDGILICIDRDKSQITYSAANNNPIIIRDQLVLKLPGDKMPVGPGIIMHDFQKYEMNLQKGDTLYIYSDGFADQFGGPKGKKFKYQQLNELIVKISHLPLDKQKELLKESFLQWKGDLEQVDDVCVFGMRI